MTISPFQSRGDRYYNDDEIKLSLHSVTVLKAMNSTYPNSSRDFDKDFLFHLLREVFTREELVDCAKSSTLLKLNRPKLKFVKGTSKANFHIKIKWISSGLVMIYNNIFCSCLWESCSRGQKPIQNVPPIHHWNRTTYGAINSTADT